MIHQNGNPADAATSNGVGNNRKAGRFQSFGTESGAGLQAIRVRLSGVCKAADALIMARKLRTHADFLEANLDLFDDVYELWRDLSASARFIEEMVEEGGAA